MKKPFPPALLVLSALISGAYGQQSHYIEAEDFQFSGDWIFETYPDSYGRGNLRSANTTGAAEADTVISLPSAGTYHVWTRSRDFTSYAGQRRFQIGIDGTLLPAEAGAHGVDGWFWENLGSRTLGAGQHVLTIRDATDFYGRCDAIYLAADSTNPNSLTYAQLSASQVNPTKVAYRSIDFPQGPMLRYSAAGDVTVRMRPLLNGTTLTHYLTEGALRFAPANGSTATALLDLTSSDGTATVNRFRNATISVDVRFGAAQQSFGIFSRIPSAETDSFLTLVNCDNGGAGTSEQYRIFAPGTNPQTGGVAATTLLNETSNNLSPSIWYTFRLAVRNTGTGAVALTLEILNRATGALIITKNATSGSTPLAATGEIGLRFYTAQGGGNVIDVDNLSVVEDIPSLAQGGTRTQVATLSGSGTRLTFYAQPDVNGETQITRDTQILTGTGSWVTLPLGTTGEKMVLLYRPAAASNLSSLHPRWSQHVDFDYNGVVYSTGILSENPYIAAENEALIPRSCTQLNAGTVQIGYRTLSGKTATGQWQIGQGGKDAKVSLTYTADRTGDYSFGISAFESWNSSQTAFHLLPPLFQYQRLPASPLLLTSSVTPQAIALVQKNVPGINGPVSFAVAADPSGLPYEWPTASNATYGFSLLSDGGQVQPSVFSPVLGLAGSRLQSGQIKTVTWRLETLAGDWKAGLEYASEAIFGVTDYRQAYNESLTGTVLNMIDLVRDANASGWDAALKAPYQIESGRTVTQASPLTFLSLALLTRDDQLYRTRSLPTLEYTLSRPKAHFATEVVNDVTHPSYVTAATTQLKVPSDFCGTAYWQGVHDLLGKKNGWLPALALKSDGSVRHSGAGFLPVWLEKLGKYRLNPSAALLTEIQNDCNSFLATEVYGQRNDPFVISWFYHLSAYPFWWGLLDLYEITGNNAYLNAAEECAFHTLAGIFSHPIAPGGNYTVHPGGNFTGITTVWWKGPVRYRLGWPRTAGDTPERSVPAWLVSPVGLTLEQPTTYYDDNPVIPELNMQMMAAWAPHLMRLYQYTGREIYNVYARNCVIGRMSNEPGYYNRGFTDMFHHAQYPYNGPDVTSFYYHHIPARLAFLIDFLFTQAETWSSGQIQFPWVKQQGYVWFSNRIYGCSPGKVYDDTQAWPWLNRTVAQVDSPHVDWFLAKSVGSFWVVLMNETNSSRTVNLTTQASAVQILTGQPVRKYQGDQEVAGNLPYASVMPVTIPAKEIVALRFPTQTQNVFPVSPALAGGRATQALPSSWGNLEAFRIRSPFGSDSLYVVLTGRPAAGSRARLAITGQTPVEKTAYPYEFSVYPWPMNANLTFRIEMIDPQGNQTNSSSITLNGTP